MKRSSLLKTLVAILFCALLVVPAVAQKSQKTEKPKTTQSAGTFKEMLAKHVGKQTNLGKLAKVGTDFITVESDDATTMIALHAVVSFKVVKDEETSEERLEITLVAGD
ncbi:MAG: hypothetical protein ACKVRP_05260 [Bacteroidota bacterium]